MYKTEEHMVHITGITNQKGGVGKSSTALALGYALTHIKARALVIDLDPQGNVSYSLNADHQIGSIYDVLIGEKQITDVIQKNGPVHCVRADPSLAGADTVLTKTGKEYRLKEALVEIYSNYDFIIIDTPPTLGILTINALAACNDIIIPSQADMYSLQGISQLQQTIEVIKKYCNSTLKVLGILITRFNPRIVLNREIVTAIEELAIKFETKVFNTRIRESVVIRESQAEQADLFTYIGKGNAVIDYIDFTGEYLGATNGKKEL
ncbi:ParA family protein [Treponema sp. OttesenSCG-928-L16]|nr:ParA family protein [Treponema sp. OttesenSCG-928-L16]